MVIEEDAALQPRVPRARQALHRQRHSGVLQGRFSSTEKVEVEYPIGHRRRREEGIPVLEQKFLRNLNVRFPAKRSDAIYALCLDQERLESMAVNEFVELFVI